MNSSYYNIVFVGENFYHMKDSVLSDSEIVMLKNIIQAHKDGKFSQDVYLSDMAQVLGESDIRIIEIHENAYMAIPLFTMLKRCLCNTDKQVKLIK